MPKANLLKQILETTQSVWDRPDTRPAIRKNFRAVINCGTPALGWEVYASDTEEKRCYHRCKSRFCPSCGYRATLLWLEQQEASLPDIPYAGIVFTMPRELWSVFGRNRHLLHDLPVVGASVIKQWIRSRYGANVLVVVVPHTFGGDLKFNSHLHILISAGGFQESSGRWIPFLRLEKDAIMRGWRHAVIDHLHRALKAGVLRSNLTAKDLSKILIMQIGSASIMHGYGEYLGCSAWAALQRRERGRDDRAGGREHTDQETSNEHDPSVAKYRTCANKSDSIVRVQVALLLTYHGTLS